MDRAQDLVQSQPVLHRQNELGDQVPGVAADDGDAQDAVAAWPGEHLDETIGCVVRDGAVQVIDAVARHSVRHALRPRFLLVQAHARDLGLGEGRPGDHAVVGLEASEAAEERVDRGIPGLVRSHVRELVGAGDVAAGIDVGIEHLQVLVAGYRAGLCARNAQLLQPQARGIGGAAHGHEHGVERNLHGAALVLGAQALAAGVLRELARRVTREHAQALGLEAEPHQFRNLGILARQKARAHLDLGDFAAQARKGLRQFATDRSAAQHQQAARALAQRPHGVGSEVAHGLEPGDGRHEGPGAGGNHDGARAERARALGVAHLDGPGRGDARAALDAIHAQFGVALDRVVRSDFGDHALHALHGRGKVDLDLGAGHAELARPCRLGDEARAADQRLGGHAAGVEAVPTHAVLLDQGHLRARGGGDVGRYQAGRARAYHHHVVVGAAWTQVRPGRVDLACLERVDELLGEQREQAQEGEGREQRRRDQSAERADLAQLGTQVHVHRGAGQHAQLAHPGVGPGADAREPHGQVDHEEGKQRHQAQREEVEAALAGDAGVDRREFLGEARTHAVGQHVAGDQHGC